MSGPGRSGTFVPLGDLFAQALEHMQSRQDGVAAEPATASRCIDGFIFSGNRHDSVPRALLLDNRLTPLERNAWQVVRLMLKEDGVTTLSTYDQFAPWLSSLPLTARASHETVARALTVLRLTRWTSLVQRRRDPKTGRVQGNLYVLHDAPLTPFEAIQLDSDYLALVGRSLSHASRSIQRIGLHTLEEMVSDPQLGTLPSRLQVLSERLAGKPRSPSTSNPQAVDSDDSEEGGASRLRNWSDPTSESEAGDKRTDSASLRNPKTGRTVHIKDNSEDHTVPPTRANIRFPDRFNSLKAEQQSGALAAMQAVDPGLHQAILDEWDARCRTSDVRNPAGYLFGIVQKALRNEFRAWAGRKPSSAAEAHEQDPPRNASDPERAREHIARLQSLLRSS